MAKHHYVSKFYYKNFVYSTEDPLVYTMNKEGKISNRRRAASQIGYETDYNTPDQEQTQSQLETRYAKTLSEFIKTADKEKYDFSNEVTETGKIVYVFSDGFLEFVSFMLGNNIFVRKKLASVYTVDKIVPSGVELNNSNIVIDGDYSGKFDWSVSFSGCVYKELKNWALGLVRLDPETSRSYFITSDNPVSLFNPENIYAPIDLRLKHDESKTKFTSNASKDRIDLEVVVTLENVSFGQDVVLTFPITPRLCLIGFSCSAREYSFKEGSKNGLIEFVNLMTFGQCNKDVYSHSKRLLAKTRANLLSFRNYCAKKNLVPSFEVGIQ